jgi:hypothetical protein
MAGISETTTEATKDDTATINFLDLKRFSKGNKIGILVSLTGSTKTVSSALLVVITLVILNLLVCYV